MTRQLQELGHEVVVLDWAEDGLPPLIDHVWILDVRSGAIEWAVQDCDAVVHLAGIVGVRETEADPRTCLEVSAIGIQQVVRVCLKRGRRLLVASSSEVYGDSELPLTEESPVNPRSSYAVGKLFAEHLALAQPDLDVRVARFFNVYGPEQRPEFVVSRMAAAVRAGEQPVVYGPGTQLRSFCHVTDAARSVVQLLVRDGLDKEIVNIGSAEPVQMSVLARRLCLAAGGKLEPAFVPFEQSDRARSREIWTRMPDVSKACRLLGHETTVSLADGLREMLYLV